MFNDQKCPEMCDKCGGECSLKHSVLSFTMRHICVRCGHKWRGDGVDADD